jgi:hypothetical protein
MSTTPVCMWQRDGCTRFTCSFLQTQCRQNSTSSSHQRLCLAGHVESCIVIAAVKEPHGLTRSDCKRPDGLTLIPWREDRCTTWDVTVTDTTAVSYIATTSSLAGSAAEAAALRKEAKYTDLSHSYCLLPLAFETMGPINVEGLSFLSQLGHRISTVTEDPPEISFLFQRISIVIQRFN